MQLFHHFLTNEECDHIIKVVELLQCAYCGCWDGAHGKSALASADGKAAQLGPELAPASAKAAHRPSPPQIASPHIARSTVVNPDGSISDDPIRTSWGTFLSRAQDEVVFAIEQRIANWTHLPVSHAGRQGRCFLLSSAVGAAAVCCENADASPCAASCMPGFQCAALSWFVAHHLLTLLICCFKHTCCLAL